MWSHRVLLLSVTSYLTSRLSSIKSAILTTLSYVTLVPNAQFEALAGFSAVVDRLGEFAETVDALKEKSASPVGEKIELKSQNPPEKPEQPLLKVENLTLLTPDTRSVLIEDLSFEVR